MSTVLLTELEPRQQNGFWVWSDSWQGVEVRFVGTGPPWQSETLLPALDEPDPPAVAWARQVHGSSVLEAGVGSSGEGDALISRQSDLAVSVVTADCVPVLLGGASVVAAIHAGWRGIEAGIVGETLSRIDLDRSRLIAWIGPSIRACCYEVEAEVAARIEAVSPRPVALPGPRGRPHLDLVGAVQAQLLQAGLSEIRVVSACTRCESDRLASYRREGKGGGRNISLAWLRSEV